MSMTMQDLEDAINGLAIITRGQNGSVISFRLTTAEKVRYKQFIEQGYAVRDGKTNIFTAYSKWCDINNSPQIYIKSKKIYTHIELDMIFTKYRLSEVAVQQVEYLFDMYCVYQKVKTPSLNNRPGATWSYCDRIIKEDANIVALELVKIANNREYWVE